MQASYETYIPLTLPPDTDVGVYDVPGWGFFVFLVRSPRCAGPYLLQNPGGLSVTLSHEYGIRWPDRGGERLTELALAADAVAIWIFGTGPDAIQAYRRVSGAIGRRAWHGGPTPANLHL